MTILTRILLGLALVTGVPAVQLQAGTGCPPAGCDSGCSSSCLEGCAKEVTNIKIKEGVSIKNYYCRTECCPSTDDGVDGDSGGTTLPLDICDAPGQPLTNCEPLCLVADNQVCMPSQTDSTQGECVLKVPDWATSADAPELCTWEECNVIDTTNSCVEGQVCEVYHPDPSTIVATCVTSGTAAPTDICDISAVGNPASCGDQGLCATGNQCLDVYGTGFACYAAGDWRGAAVNRENRVDCLSEDCTREIQDACNTGNEQCKVYSVPGSAAPGISWECVPDLPETMCTAGLTEKIVRDVGQDCPISSPLGACGPDEMCVKVGVNPYDCYVDATGYTNPWASEAAPSMEMCSDTGPCNDLGDLCTNCVIDKECKVSLGGECACSEYTCKLWTVTADNNNPAGTHDTTTEIKYSCSDDTNDGQQS